jgi:O-acetyl-ADP-ribose deacetylase (regulator of RNase III)
MFEYIHHGNLLKAEAEALVNTVNTEGVMGKGIALQFKRAFPANYERYRRACEAGDVQLGKMFVTGPELLHGPRLIVNFPTKAHWKSRSRLADIEVGLQDLRRVLLMNDVKSVAVPPLGCGLGGLNWADVKPRIEAALGDLPIHVQVFEPSGTPAAAEMVDRRARPKMTAGRAALIGLLARYLMPGDFASPLVLQKLAYFLQEAGEPLNLGFDKGKYGPYADQLRHAVIAMEGHFVSGFGDGTKASEIRLMPGAVEEADSFLARSAETISRFDRVVKLISGFESPYGLELLSTAHWVAAHDGADSPGRAVESVQAWSSRKKGLFSAEHITAAWNRLADEGWLALDSPDGRQPDG